MEVLAGTAAKPTNAQHAALRILLEDVEPLMARAEQTASTLAQVHADLHSDLDRLGALVKCTVDAQPALLEASRKLAGSAARIETAMQPAAPRSGAQPQQTLSQSLRSPFVVIGACLASAVLSALVVNGMHGASMREIADQARLGRALQLAWPTLDAAARMKVREVIER